MSLHRYFVPPPLAIALSPAPALKLSDKQTEKPHDKAEKNQPHPDHQVQESADGEKADYAKQDKQIPRSQKVEEDKQPAKLSSKKAVEKIQDEETPQLSLRLVGVAPARPVKVKLELDPILPYPPINTDPRGAYYKYAKFVQGEFQLIDVTKDGWLTEQWHELPEREALARLKGETDKGRERQFDQMKRLSQLRKVPQTTREILLDLWNDLVITNSHECEVDRFWARYDWCEPATHIHLSPLKDGVSFSPEVEWTREGIEETLASVGVQLLYTTTKPLPRSWAEPSGAYLVLGHGFFMLRLENVLQWKPAGAKTQKFEMLVTSGNDRVFGNMVKAQQAVDRKKKEATYREKKAAEKLKAEEDKKAKDVSEGVDRLSEKRAQVDGEGETHPKRLPAQGDSIGQRKDAQERTKLQPGKETQTKLSGREPQRKAELLGKMLASGDPQLGMKMEDVKLALKTLEAVSQQKKEAKKPVIWVWHDSCERWRWGCFEAGFPLVSPGGWEERDWRVFADDRGCIDFDLEEGWAEDDEEDVHDWSC